MSWKDFLEERHIDYQIVDRHDEPVAQSTVLNADHGYAYVMALTSPEAELDLTKISHALNGSEVKIAEESEFEDKCDDCHAGAIPPIGAAFNMETLVDEKLASRWPVLLPSDQPHEALRMDYENFIRATSPLIVDITS